MTRREPWHLTDVEAMDMPGDTRRHDRNAGQGAGYHLRQPLPTPEKQCQRRRSDGCPDRPCRRLERAQCCGKPRGRGDGYEASVQGATSGDNSA
jgi:hypothetical protein